MAGERAPSPACCPERWGDAHVILKTMIKMKTIVLKRIIMLIIFLPGGEQKGFAQSQHGGPSLALQAYIHSVNYEHNVNRSIYFSLQKFSRDYKSEVPKTEGAVHYPTMIRPDYGILAGGYYHIFKLNKRLDAIGIASFEMLTSSNDFWGGYHLWTGLRYRARSLNVESIVKVWLNKDASQRISEWRFGVRRKKKLDKFLVNSSFHIGFHPELNELYSISESGWEVLYFFSISRELNSNLFIKIFFQGRFRTDFVEHSTNELDQLSLSYKIVYSKPQNHSIGLTISKGFSVASIIDYFSKNKAPGFHLIANAPLD